MTMNIAVFGRSIKPEGHASFNTFIQLCEENKISLSIFQTLYDFLKSSSIYLPKNVCIFSKKHDFSIMDFAFSIGGDGTFLRTARMVGAAQTPIIGINTGRLGFLADIPETEMHTVLESIFTKNYTVENRSVLKIEESDCPDEVSYALNDISLLRRDTSSLIIIHVYINDALLNSFWADGIILATPTGSTAYSLSAGGPIVVPGTNNFIITPIAPHSLTVRPIIIPDNSKLRIEVESRSNTYMLSIDSRSKAMGITNELKIEKAEFPVKVFQLKSFSYYETLRNKLLWGKDIRTNNR